MAVQTIEEIRSLQQIYELCSCTDDEFDNWLSKVRLIHVIPVCKCGNETRLEMRRRRNKIQKLYRCVDSKCRKTRGFYHNTFFEHANISAKEIFQLSWHWATGRYAYEDIRREMARADGSTLSSKTLVDWYQFFRDVCIEHISRHPTVIGGPGVIVEIYETVLSRRNYGCGRPPSRQWLFGGIERGSNCCFIVPIEKRDAATLFSLIKQYIRPGSIILSDRWSTYGEVENFLEAYRIDQLGRFVGPESSTKSIEGNWQEFKVKVKTKGGVSHDLLFGYMLDFIWRSRFAWPQRFAAFWTHVREQYSL